jgi:hypothetical protein
MALAIVATAFALAAVAVAMGLRRDALVPVSLAALLPLAPIWAAGYAVMQTGWRDVDGWVDCYGYCHAWHYVGAGWRKPDSGDQPRMPCGGGL